MLSLSILRLIREVAFKRIRVKPLHEKGGAERVVGNIKEFEGRFHIETVRET